MEITAEKDKVLEDLKRISEGLDLMILRLNDRAKVKKRK